MSAGTKDGNVRVTPVEREEDFPGAYDCTAAAFGQQTKDGIWMAMTPGWDTAEGREKAIQRFKQGWKNASRDKDGNLNTIFLKAAVDHAESETGERIVGFAVWLQASAVEGRGEPVPDDEGRRENARKVYPDNENEARYLYQLYTALHRQRGQAVREKVDDANPSMMVLDLCVVDPAFQGRGIARRLVQYGLDEAKRRGDLEATTEGSVMGRKVYERMGFEQEGPEMAFEVDEEFAPRDRPSNIFMRTKRGVRN